MREQRPDQTFRKIVASAQLNTGVVTSAPLPSEHSSAFAHPDHKMSNAILDHVQEIHLLHDEEPQSDARPFKQDIEATLPSIGAKSNEHTGVFAQAVNKKRWVFPVGVVGALLAGAAFPVAGWMTGGAVKSLGDSTLRPSFNTWSLWFFILAFVVLLIYL